MKKFSLMCLDLKNQSARVGDHPSTWDYVICRPELCQKKDVYLQLDELNRVYGAPIDSVGTVRRHFDKKAGTTLMFALVVDKTKEVFAYSETERIKLLGAS